MIHLDKCLAMGDDVEGSDMIESFDVISALDYYATNYYHLNTAPFTEHLLYWLMTRCDVSKLIKELRK